MKPVVLHRQARIELDQAIAFYERQKPGLGLDLRNAVERAIGRIQQNPQLGAPYKATGFRHDALRRFPYVIFYTELEVVIWIAAVAHGKRRPGYWRSRRIE